MAIKRFLFIPLAGLVASTAYAFPIEFTQTLCTAQTQPLTEEVAQFEDRLARTQRLETRSSQHRRHVERHAAELLDALTSATETPSCDESRKALISGWVNRFEKLI